MEVSYELASPDEFVLRFDEGQTSHSSRNEQKFSKLEQRLRGCENSASAELDDKVKVEEVPELSPPVAGESRSRSKRETVDGERSVSTPKRSKRSETVDNVKVESPSGFGLATDKVPEKRKAPVSMEASLAKLEAELMRKQHLLEIRENKMREKESLLLEREAVLKERDLTLSNRERELYFREEQVHGRPEHLASEDESEKIKDIRSEYEEKIASLDDYRKRIRAVHRDLMWREAAREKTEKRKKFFKNTARLGHISIVRRGTSLDENWQDGQAFFDLAVRQNALQKEKEEVERLIRLRKKEEKHKDRREAVKEDKGWPIEFYMEEYRNRLLAIRKEEQELIALGEKLEVEKQLHIRELKRTRDEGNSRFGSTMVLNDRYVCLHLLGRGGFSEVYKAYDLDELRDVACKVHQLNSAWSERKKANYIKHACREYNIHRSICHPHVVQLYDVLEIDENSFCTVLEYCPRGDLDVYLKQHGCLVEKEARRILIQIFSGLQSLNQLDKPVIHYDLKPGNILFSKYYEAKLCDFGLAKIVEDESGDVLDGGVELTSQGAGTYWYLPPECFTESGSRPPVISNKVDVWSCGVIYFQMLFGRKPFGDDMSQRRLLAEKTIVTSAQELVIPAKPVVSPEAKEFIKRCLIYEASERPDVEQILQDAYLSLKPRSSSRSKTS